MKKYNSVAEFLDDLDQNKKDQVEALRKVILGNKNITEHIKWNAPSYVYDGEDRITFNLQNKEGLVRLVLHMGATRKENKKGEPLLKDATGLIVWNSDIRGMLTFDSLDDIKSKHDPTELVIKRWLAIKP
jgi:hypothetical protein